MWSREVFEDLAIGSASRRNCSRQTPETIYGPSTTTAMFATYSPFRTKLYTRSQRPSRDVWPPAAHNDRAASRPAIWRPMIVSCKDGKLSSAEATPKQPRSYFAVPLNWIPTLRKLMLRSEEHTSELQSLRHLVCRLL